MRAIIIDPVARVIREANIAASPSFMRDIAAIIGTDALGLDVAPPHTAMFLDAIGFLRASSFWRKVAGQPQDNVAGVGVMFGLDAAGKLADLPAAITVDGLQASIVWVDDVIVSTVEHMEIVQFPGGPAPRVHREVVWQPGAVTPADGGRSAAPPVDGVDLYSQGSPPAAVSPSAATPIANAVPEAAQAASLAPIWAIHETPDNRYRVIEYEVTGGGLGAPLSLATVPNIDEARSRIPKGLHMRPADDDAEDDTLVETWS